MKKIGFIGVGIMGKSMVRNLMKAGFELHIYARTRSKVEDVISEGAIFHETIADCVKDCDAVITIVGFPVDVEEVYFDKGNILDSAKEGAYLIDMTTTSPMLDQKIAEEGTKRGFHVLDAPVTGGDTGAKAGTLSILVGGSREDYEACMPLFKAMGANINYQGAAGSGQHAKLANQIMIAGTLSGVCEALTYAKAKGLDLQTVLNSVSTGAAGSKQLDTFGPKILAGVIGGKVRKSAMETVKMSFGQKGSILFAVLNVLQLVGWTAIMIYDGALAADGVMHTGRWIWCLVIGALIILWIVIGITNLGKINTVAMAALFILTLILCKVIFTGSGVETPSDDSMTFGAAVELAVAMPLSWLPLISDYTREAKEPVKATAVSAVTYGIVSCWMYVIGMGAAIITGEYDIAQIMLKAGLGILGLLIIVFSTVTTTFLDAYSAGISSETVVSRWNGKHVAIVVTVIGTAAAIVYPMDNITDFLYLIGSVFAPMIAIQIADFFLLKQDKSSRAIYVPNMIIWVIGFVVYRILMNVDMPVGNTLPDMVITIILCLIAGKLIPEKNQKK